MARKPTFEAVLDCLYLSHIEPEANGLLPGMVGDWLGAGTCGLWFVDPQTGQPNGWQAINIPDDMIALYKAHYASLDPWLVPFLSAPANTARHGHALVPMDEFARSAFNNEFARPGGMYHQVNARVRTAGSRPMTAAFVAHRSHRHDPFTSGTLERMEALLPHISRSLVLQAALPQAARAAARGTLAGLLAAMADPALVCDGHGRVVQANAGVDAMAGLGFLRLAQRMGQRTLAVADPDAARQVSRALASAASGGPGGTVHLGGGAFAFVSPLPPGFADRLGAKPGLVLVVLRPGAAGADALVASLRDVFSLSRAEAEVACALAAGDAPAAIAERRGVKVSTIRTLLERALVKTGAKDLRALAALLAALPHRPA